MSSETENSGVIKQVAPVSHTQSGPGTSGTSGTPTVSEGKGSEDAGNLPGQVFVEPVAQPVAPPTAQPTVHQPAYGQPVGYGPNYGYPANTVVVQQPRQQGFVPVVRPSDYLTCSIVSFFFCWPMAICAIMYSCNSKSSANAGDYPRAESEGRTARNISIVAIIFGLIIVALCVGVPLGLITRQRVIYNCNGIGYCYTYYGYYK